DEVRINPVVGKRQPLDGRHTLAQRAEIRNSDEGPFCSRPHIDQNSPGVSLEAGPNLVHGHVLDFDGVGQTLTLDPSPWSAKPLAQTDTVNASIHKQHLSKEASAPRSNQQDTRTPLKY